MDTGHTKEINRNNTNNGNNNTNNSNNNTNNSNNLISREDSIRQTNNDRQIQIINDLISKKSNLISKFIGNLSLEEAKTIIQNEYNSVKQGINQLNLQFDNNQKDIKSKKVLIKSLLMEKESILSREKSILDKELLRIENKNKEEEETNKNQLLETINSLHNLLNTERELEMIIQEKEDYIKTFKYNRAKLRQLHIEKINKQHEEHKKRQTIKLELEYQLLGLQGQINEVQKNINDYEVSRHNINQDYYNWKNEIKITQDMILPLQKEIKTWIISNNMNSMNNMNNDISNIDENTVWTTNFVTSLEPLLQNIDNSLNNIDLNSNFDINIDSNFDMTKLPRLQQLLVIWDNLESDLRKDTSSRYARLELEHKKNIKRKHRLEKIINKFSQELKQTSLFKKIKVDAPDLTEDENEYNNSKNILQSSSQELKGIKETIIEFSNKVKKLENRNTTLDKIPLSDTLQKDNERALSRWKKVQTRCENKYDTQCNSLGEDIGLLFQKITTLTTQLKMKETRWTAINTNPSIILEEYHNNLHLNNDNINNICNNNSVNNLDKQQHLQDIKSDIMEIINMKKSISRIQAKR